MAQASIPKDPEKRKKLLSPERLKQIELQSAPQQNVIGGQQVSASEFEVAKSLAGIGSAGGGIITPQAQAASQQFQESARAGQQASLASEAVRQQEQEKATALAQQQARQEALSPQQQALIQGGEELSAELTGKILNQPSLKPVGAEETIKRGTLDLLGVSEESQEVFLPTGVNAESLAFKAIKGEASDKEKTALKEYIKGSALAAGGIVLGGLIGSFAKAGISSSIASKAGKSSSAMKTAGGALVGGILGAGGVSGVTTNLFGSKIDVLEAEIEKMASQSSTIQSAVQNGALSPEEGLQRLRKMAKDIDDAESAIRQASIYNVKFRFSNGYLETQERIADARSNILERVGGITNIIETGSIAENPQELALLYAQEVE